MRERSPNEVLNWLVVVLALSVPLYRAWVSLAAYLILILWFFQGGIRTRLERLAHHPTTLAVVGFVALNLLSLLWSENPADGLAYWRKYLYLLLVPAIASSLRPGFTRKAFLAFIAGTLLSIAMMPVVILADIHVRRIHPGNPAATMSHLDYSMVLAVAGLLVVVHLAVGTGAWRQRLPWIPVLVAVIGGLVFNIGRSGQLAFVASLVILVAFLSRKRPIWQRAAALAAAVFLVLGAYAAVPRFQSRVDAGVDELRAAVVEHRIETNQGKRVAGAFVALDMIRSHPLIGTGIGANMPEFRRLLESDFPEYREAIGWFPHLHNQYLQVTTELGVVGLISMLAIFVALMAGRYRSAEIQAAAVAVGCAYLFGFIGDPFLRKQLTLVLFSLSVGIISADDRAFSEGSPGPDPTADG